MLFHVASSLAALAAVGVSCNDGIVDHLYGNHFVVINSTSRVICFSYDNGADCELGIHDTLCCDNISDCVIFKAVYGGNPKVRVGNDSVIHLTNSNYSCWPYNCTNTRLGEYEWLHTYVIDDEWLTEAWLEATSGECSPGAKGTLYDM